MSASALAVRDLRIDYDERTVLEVARLAVAPGAHLTLMGHNGAGKSTLLRVLGLLEQPDAGSLEFAGEPVSWESSRRLLALRRRTATVMQQPLLCRMSVARNVALGLRFRGLRGREVAARVGPWLERLGIAALRDRAAGELSGGEAQRVSLARALVLEPEVLLLDEPFAALDAPTRQELLADFQQALVAARVTTVFATHDRGEALALGGEVAVLLDGRLAQLGPAEEIFVRPASEEVARFVGVETLLPGQVLECSEGVVKVAAGVGVVEVVAQAGPGEEVLVSVRPEEVLLLPGGASTRSSARNHFRGRVVKIVASEAAFRVEVDCGAPVVALVTRPSFREMALETGSEVQVAFKATAAHLIRRTGG